MSLVMRSNNIATNSLGNINGIKGSQDWLVFADFENNQYAKKTNNTRENISLSETVTCTSAHNLVNKPITIDKLGNQTVITQANQVRTWLEKGKFGLLVDSSRDNHFAESSAPITRNITISATAPIVVWCTGIGSVTVSGDKIETKVVTENNPQVFAPTVSTGTIDITCTVIGSLSHVQVERAAGFTLKTSEIKAGAIGQSGTATRAPDVVKLNSSLLSEIIAKATTGITIVMQTVPVGLMPEARATSPEQRLTLIDSSGNKSFIGVNRLPSKISPRLLNYNSANVSVLSKSGNQIDYLTSNPAMTQAVCLIPNFEKVYLNGVGGVSDVTSSAISLTEIGLLNGTNNPVQQAGNAIITKLAIYGRPLTDSELQEISTSWL